MCALRNHIPPSVLTSPLVCPVASPFACSFELPFVCPFTFPLVFPVVFPLSDRRRLTAFLNTLVGSYLTFSSRNRWILGPKTRSALVKTLSSSVAGTALMFPSVLAQSPPEQISVDNDLLK